MFVRQDKDGNWYVYKRTTKTTKRGKRGRVNKTSETNKNKSFRNWFLIKNYGASPQITTNYCIIFPREFIGKKVRLKIEVIENNGA